MAKPDPVFLARLLELGHEAERVTPGSGLMCGLLVGLNLSKHYPEIVDNMIASFEEAGFAFERIEDIFSDIEWIRE